MYINNVIYTHCEFTNHTEALSPFVAYWCLSKLYSVKGCKSCVTCCHTQHLQFSVLSSLHTTSRHSKLILMGNKSQKVMKLGPASESAPSLCNNLHVHSQCVSSQRDRKRDA